MPILTAQQHIYQALRKCGSLRPGYTPQMELLADALNEWGTMFDEWQAEREMGFSIPQFVYPVTGPGSQQNGNGYEIGPTAADWVGPRPTSIVRANLVFTSGGQSPVYIHLRPISAEEWAALSIREIPAINVTSLFYYDPQYPNGVFNVFPPLNGNSIELFTWGFLAVPAALAENYSAPPGYQDAVIKTLAERLWPMLTHDICVHKNSQMWLAGQAYTAREKVKAVNRSLPTLCNDFGKTTGGDAPLYDSFVTDTGFPY